VLEAGAQRAAVPAVLRVVDDADLRVDAASSSSDVGRPSLLPSLTTSTS
jgi:hypothetical protein